MRARWSTQQPMPHDRTRLITPRRTARTLFNLSLLESTFVGVTIRREHSPPWN